MPLKIRSFSLSASRVIGVILLTAIASILILYYKNIAILLVIIYLWLMVYKCNKEYNMKEKIYNQIDLT